MDYTLLYVIVALGISIVLNILLKKIGISQIIGYIFTGTIIVYAFDLRSAVHSHELELLGEFGIVFLMFTIGLEISLAKMGNMRQEIFGNGFLQVGLTTIVVYLGAYYLFGLDAKSAIIVAFAFSLSSTAVVLSYLKSSKEIYTPYGQKATGILIFQDIAVIPILILIGFLSSEADESIYVIIGDTILSAVVAVGLLFVVGKRVVTWLLHFSASSELEELFMGSVLFIVVGASLFASFMGFTYSLGAFIAGMIIAETRYHHKVESEIAPFKDILLGTFFVTVGMKVDIGIFIENVDMIIEVFLLVLTIKTLLIFCILKFSQSSATSLKTALSLSQVGEFSFVIFAVASAGNILDDSLVSLFVLVVILSMVITPFFITRINEFTQRLVKESDIITDMSRLKACENHVIVCGYSVVGKFVAKYLEEFDAPYIVVDNSNKHVKEALEDNIEKASAIIVTLDNIDKKRLICESILKHSKNANVVVKVVSLEEKQKLADLDITVIVDGKVEVARVLVERMLSCQLYKHKE